MRYEGLNWSQRHIAIRQIISDLGKVIEAKKNPVSIHKTSKVITLETLHFLTLTNTNGNLQPRTP